MNEVIDDTLNYDHYKTEIMLKTALPSIQSIIKRNSDVRPTLNRPYYRLMV